MDGITGSGVLLLRCVTYSQVKIKRKSNSGILNHEGCGGRMFHSVPSILINFVVLEFGAFQGILMNSLAILMSSITGTKSGRFASFSRGGTSSLIGGRTGGSGCWFWVSESSESR